MMLSAVVDECGSLLHTSALLQSLWHEISTGLCFLLHLCRAYLCQGRLV
jgi:hypothetical protein